jgi:hypothetical protein
MWIVVGEDTTKQFSIKNYYGPFNNKWSAEYFIKHCAPPRLKSYSVKLRDPEAFGLIQVNITQPPSNLPPSVALV